METKNARQTMTLEELRAAEAKRTALLFGDDNGGDGRLKELVDATLTNIPVNAALVFTDEQGVEQRIPLNTTEHGQYAVIFPGLFNERQLAPSKSSPDSGNLTATIRVNLGQGKAPLVVQSKDDPNKFAQRGFGSFNINLTVSRKK